MRIGYARRYVAARAVALSFWAFPLLTTPIAARAQADASRYFRITVMDAETGRGVPLVELRTVSEVRYYTDSNGIVALDDPELMGRKVYFYIKSHGYTFPKDGFGYRGMALDVAAGGQAVLKITRENIAERLYRITGSGIYRDSVLLGLPAPLKQPLLDGAVMGQDTVEAAPYRGKLYWFWGDTNRPGYPLGQFATSGATSLLPGQGGLDPDAGVDLSYWVDHSGFSRPMIPIPKAPGPVWIGGLFTLNDNGRERLFTHFAEVKSDSVTVVSGLAEFDDEKAIFEPICTYPLDNPLHPEGEPFRVRENGTEFLYFETQQMGAFPLVRNLPDRSRLIDPTTYEGFTCLAPGTRYRKADTQIDRAPDGRVVWAWKKNTPAIGENEAQALVASHKLRQDEVLTQLRDIETDNFVISHGGSVFWNPYRKRWIQITTQVYGSPSFLGEVWFSEADTPVGPWLYARRIATHDHYTFYNPTQHPFFDQDGGRRIYFEGTYTDTYSDVKDITPRYNYNQLMYRLSLDDPRLSLPAPVYQIGRGNKTTYGLREDVERMDSWNRITAIPFYAVPAGYAHKNLVPIYPTANAFGMALQAAPNAASQPLFYALPTKASAGEKPSPSVVALYEYRNNQTGTLSYATEGHAPPLSTPATRSAQPICRVWRNPSSVLALDYAAQPVP